MRHMNAQCTRRLAGLVQSIQDLHLGFFVLFLSRAARFVILSDLLELVP